MPAVAAHRSFLSDVLSRQHDRRRAIEPDHTFLPQPCITGYTPITTGEHEGQNQAGPSKRKVVNYVEEEETVRNDLSGWYVQSGEFGSNHIFGAAEHEICEEYPALRRLMDLKAQHVDHHSHPPLHLTLPSSDASSITSSLGPSARFDVILLRPLNTWEETAALPIRTISADPGFVFLWVGKGDDEGLERGRECFAKWGFRRAEDIVWVKTNRRNHDEGAEAGAGSGAGGGGLFASSKEHCLMGIRGTVRRSTDSKFVHCNVDTDVIVYEQEDPRCQDDNATLTFPPYLYTLIENFCLGARRLELFGDPSTTRRGWVTASLPSSKSANAQEYGPATYPSFLPRDETNARPVVPFHPEIDQLRPKSPTRRAPGGPSRNTAVGISHGHSLPPRPPRHHLPPHAPADANAAMAMQVQMHMQMQMQAQAQMMNAMNMGMMDPMMMAHAQAQAQAQAMQMQMQMQAMAQGQGQNYQGQLYGEQQGQGQYDQHTGQMGQGQGQWYYNGQYHGGPGWGWQQ